MTGFKYFYSTQKAFDGIETAYMILKGQHSNESIPAYQRLMALAG